MVKEYPEDAAYEKEKKRRAKEREKELPNLFGLTPDGIKKELSNTKKYPNVDVLRKILKREGYIEEISSLNREEIIENVIAEVEEAKIRSGTGFLRGSYSGKTTEEILMEREADAKAEIKAIFNRLKEQKLLKDITEYYVSSLKKSLDEIPPPYEVPSKHEFLFYAVRPNGSEGVKSNPSKVLLGILSLLGVAGIGLYLWKQRQAVEKKA